MKLILFFISLFLSSSAFASVSYDYSTNTLFGYIDVALYSSGIGIVVGFIILIITAIKLIKLFKSSAGFTIRF